MVTKKLKYFEFGCYSDKGIIKSSNYDGYDAFDSSNGYVFVLCDGIDEPGLKAKDLALERIRYFMEKEYIEDPYEAVRSALIYAGGYIYEYIRKHDDCSEKIAVSCLCVLIRDNKIYYSSLGNCYMFLFNGRRLYLLTQATITDTYSKDDRGLKGDLTGKKLIGSEQVPSPFVCEQALVPLNGDMILLCTDGLYDAVSEKNIRKILSDPMPVYTKACRLADMANEAGGKDNVTVQIISFYNLDHDIREFISVEHPQKEYLPKTAKIDITGNPFWNKIIIGAVLLIALYMFYDLVIYNPRPAEDIKHSKTVAVNDTISEIKPVLLKQSTDIKTQLNQFVPLDTLYYVQSGDSWGRIYQKFEVCSWFIRNHKNNTGIFDRNGDPVAGIRISIPLKYSAKQQFNPAFYQEFTIDKVGSACQYAGEDFIDNFQELIKQK